MPIHDEAERRKFARLNFSVEVTYRKHASKIEDKAALSKNISLGGICLIVYEDLKASQLLELEFHLPEDKAAVKALGRVAWTSEFVVADALSGKRLDAGIEFIKIGDNDLEKINKYVFKCTQQE